jgi:hypothetical protein
MAITRLVYASVAREHLSISELMQIRRGSKAYNSAHGISGMLCYAGGAFLHLIEGSRAEVNALYARIVQDARHSQVELISYSTTGKRECAEWPMMMISMDEPFANARRAVLVTYAKDLRFSPLTMSRRDVLAMLRDLARTERERSASIEHRATTDAAPRTTTARKRVRAARQRR